MEHIAAKVLLSSPVPARCLTCHEGVVKDISPSTVVLHWRQTYRTILPWMAQETQYCSLRYILGTVYSAKTEASEMSPIEGMC